MRSVFLLFFFLISSLAGATDYYVSSTLPGALRNIDEVNLLDLEPGDRVLFEGGQTFLGNMILGPEDLGTAAQPVVIASYGSGRATINAQTGTAIYGKNCAGIEIKDLILRTTGQASNTGHGVSVWMDLPGGAKLDHLVLDNLDISGFGGRGIQIGSKPMAGENPDCGPSGYRGIRVTNVLCHWNKTDGMLVWGRGWPCADLVGWAHENLYVANCKFYENWGDPLVSSFNTGSGLKIYDVGGATIERCVAYRNGQNCKNRKGGPVGIWAFNSNDVTIQHCESYENKTGNGSDGGGFDLDGGMTDSVIQYCYSHENQGYGYLLAQFNGARPFSGNSIRYNISQNDGRADNEGAINVWDYYGGSQLQNTQVYNNTIFIQPALQGTPAAVKFLSPVASSVCFRNNLFITTGGVRLVWAEGFRVGGAFQQNDYWPSGGTFQIQWGATTYGSLRAWRDATNQERIVIRQGTFDLGGSGDPLFRGPLPIAMPQGGDSTPPLALRAYKLQSISPVIDRGLNLFMRLFRVDPGSQDLYGTPLFYGSSFDIGAHEWTEASPTHTDQL